MKAWLLLLPAVLLASALAACEVGHSCNGSQPRCALDVALESDAWQPGAYEFELHADGTIMFYDNGGFAGLQGGNPNDFHSRVVEYTIDETAKTATLTWEFPGAFTVDPWFKNDWYAAYWGDADVLTNDNVLITIGLKAADLQSRVLEVTRDGTIVWQIDFPANQGIYRAERLSPPPLVQAMP